MDDALVVRGLQRLRDLADDVERFVQRHRSAREPVGKRLAVDELQHQRADGGARSRPWTVAMFG